jgi:hypothetical protein
MSRNTVAIYIYTIVTSRQALMTDLNTVFCENLKSPIVILHLQSGVQVDKCFGVAT